MTNKIKTNNVERPTGTYTEEYNKKRTNILKWRKNNPEYVTTYNREYQRKLRQDPVKYEELKMRVNARSYLQGDWGVSYKASSSLGMTRAQLAQKYNMTEDEFISMVNKNELDHIVSASWFNNDKNIHLKPYMYRHYNLQFLPKKINRSKHKYVDESDIRVQFVITQLELDYYNGMNYYDKDCMSKIAELSSKAVRLKTKIDKMYK